MVSLGVVSLGVVSLGVVSLGEIILKIFSILICFLILVLYPLIVQQQTTEQQTMFDKIFAIAADLAKTFAQSDIDAVQLVGGFFIGFIVYSAIRSFCGSVGVTRTVV